MYKNYTYCKTKIVRLVECFTMLAPQATPTRRLRRLCLLFLRRIARLRLVVFVKPPADRRIHFQRLGSAMDPVPLSSKRGTRTRFKTQVLQTHLFFLQHTIATDDLSGWTKRWVCRRHRLSSTHRLRKSSRRFLLRALFHGLKVWFCFGARFGSKFMSKDGLVLSPQNGLIIHLGCGLALFHPPQIPSTPPKWFGSRTIFIRGHISTRTKIIKGETSGIPK